MTSSKDLFEEQRDYERNGSPQPLTTYNAITAIQPGAESLKKVSAEIVERVHNGDLNPLKVAAHLRFFADIQKAVDSAIKKDILDELAKHGRSAFVHGAEIVPMEAGVKYDYTLCGDTVLNRLLDEQERIMALVKQRQEFLKNVGAEGQTIVDEATGEMIHVTPPTKSSTSTYKMTFR